MSPLSRPLDFWDAWYDGYLAEVKAGAAPPIRQREVGNMLWSCEVAADWERTEWTALNHEDAETF